VNSVALLAGTIPGKRAGGGGGWLRSDVEYVTVREERAVALKPSNVSFEQAASVPIAGITALQALRDKEQIHAGQKVLINGASGGVGTFAMQIAKAYGADVTGVCSTRNVDLVRSIGADHVIDYTREDFTKGAQHYDLMLDNVGTHSLLQYKRVLNPKGIFVMIGSTTPGNWFAWLATPIEGLMLSPFVSQKLGMFCGGTQPRRPCDPERSHAVGEGDTGHRQTLQTKRDPRGAAVSGKRARPRESRTDRGIGHQDLVERCARHTAPVRRAPPAMLHCMDKPITALPCWVRPALSTATPIAQLRRLCYRGRAQRDCAPHRTCSCDTGRAQYWRGVRTREPLWERSTCLAGCS
jgi:hypothetical protein